MKVTAELSGERHEIEVKRDGSRVFASVDGREYELEAGQPEPGVHLLKYEGTVYEILVSAPSNVSESFTVAVREVVLDIKIFDPRKLSGSGASEEATDGKVEIKTAMPGKLVRVLAPAGSEVAAGDGVLVVEAMKMQNEMKSPKTGVVKEIRFSEGENVNAGEVLAVIE